MNDQQLLIMIGDRIRAIRENNNLSLQELADKCGFEKSNMSRIEYGKTNMTVKTLHRISESLNVPIVALFQFDPSEYNALKRNTK